ncbi:MAG: 2Fe-2S iron-sulfur cluster binding domain-containing protein, partial [Ignavibacteriae bacterium]|nr:2Fe-2S iron-sulfur cluster binding domain-containing protein [Ignavibacteriota bacterium]
MGLRINNRLVPARLGASLFESAEAIGEYIPTSCRKQGTCRECLVEVTEGMEFLSP